MSGAEVHVCRRRQGHLWILQVSVCVCVCVCVCIICLSNWYLRHSTESTHNQRDTYLLTPSANRRSKGSERKRERDREREKERKRKRERQRERGRERTQAQGCENR